jgi:hypothetical protein
MNGAVQVCCCSRCVAGLRVLSLGAGATEESIHEAYLDLAKVWHPDRFEADQRLKARAEEQFKLIQVAVRELQEHLRKPDAAALLRRRGGDDNTLQAAGRDEVESSRARDLFRILVDGERYFLHPKLPDYAVERVRSCDWAAASSLGGFVDISLARTGRSFIAFTQQALLAREMFSTRKIPYTDLGQWNIVLSTRAMDRSADKAVSGGECGCALELRRAGESLLEPLTFSRRSQAEVFAALIRELQQSGTF